MPTLSNSLFIGLSGMRANQQGLNVTGHNISNVNTEGYTRQQINLQANDPVRINKLIFGTGVNLEEISRNRDSFLDRQLRTENGSLGDLAKQLEGMDLIESIINEPSENGLHQSIKNFFNSLQDLANNPESSSVRTTVREQGRALAGRFNQMWTQLEQIRNSKNLEVGDIVQNVNELLDRIGQLNTRIGGIEALGQEANDLRDNRDRLLDDLSKLVDISAVEDPNNDSVTVSISGQAYVVLDNVTHLEARSVNVDGHEEVRLFNPDSDERIEVRGGELHGLIEIRDRVIPGLQEQLDTLAGSMAEEINAVHRQGFGLKGVRSSPPGNLDFFEGDTAATIQLSNEINNDPGNIAASADGAPGDNTNALEMAQLRNLGVLNENRFTFEDFLTSIVSSFGLESKTVQQRQENQEILVQQLDNFRESRIGVNMDEELVQLIRFQKAFGANARVISITNELMGVVVQLGRY